MIRTAVAAIEKAYDFETAVSDKKRLEHLAKTDALTGCLNRRALSEELEAELERARRYNLALTILLARGIHDSLAEGLFHLPMPSTEVLLGFAAMGGLLGLLGSWIAVATLPRKWLL